MIQLPYSKKCNHQGTCNCSHITNASTQWYSDGVAESDQSVIEEKIEKLLHKEELKQTQHWKHKNKPRF